MGPRDTDDAPTLYSQTGCVIKYAGCPVYWQSKLQAEIALSTAELEYIAMSQAPRETTPIMSLMKEINVVFPLHILEPKFVVKVHEGNQSCITMASNLKFTPRTQHIAIKYHHFRKHVKSPSSPNGFTNIMYSLTQEQLAEISTKPTSDETLWALQMKLYG